MGAKSKSLQAEIQRLQRELKAARERIALLENWLNGSDRKFLAALDAGRKAKGVRSC
jgi:hypothetical protein